MFVLIAVPAVSISSSAWKPRPKSTSPTWLRPGDTVLDPFAGSGTVGQVALELGRRAILIELNPDYIKLIEDRTRVTPGFPNLSSNAIEPAKRLHFFD